MHMLQFLCVEGVRLQFRSWQIEWYMLYDIKKYMSINIHTSINTNRNCEYANYIITCLEFLTSSQVCVCVCVWPENNFLYLALRCAQMALKALIMCGCVSFGPNAFFQVAWWFYTFSHNHGSVKNGCISNRIVSFHLGDSFPLNHDYGRKRKIGSNPLSPKAKIGSFTSTSTHHLFFKVPYGKTLTSNKVPLIFPAGSKQHDSTLMKPCQLPSKTELRFPEHQERQEEKHTYLWQLTIFCPKKRRKLEIFMFLRGKTTSSTINQHSRLTRPLVSHKMYL